MKKLLVLFAFLLVSMPVMAWQKYDYKTGNSYNGYSDSSGNTHVNGYNYNTGSTWRTDVKSNGDMNGTDAQGNYWNYNRTTGAYHNYGTGVSCYGKGQLRTCY